MPPSAQLPWFAGQPGDVRLYRVNRRPLREGNLFAADGLPDDVFDHFTRVLTPGYEVITGRRNQRRWKVGGLLVDRDEQTLVGKLGWQPRGEAVVPDWSESDKDWTASIADPQGGQITPFGFDGETRLLAVLSDHASAATTIADVFERILRENERELLERTTEWSVEPILDAEEFLGWLGDQDVVTLVSFTAKLPNPEPREAFKDLVGRMEARRATTYRETMVGDREAGLVGIEEDPDFRQAIAMGEQGFATLRGEGRSNGTASKYSQKDTVAADHVDELPEDWTGVLDLLKRALKTRFRRYLDDGENAA